jgi:peptidoglycan hydrolase-like protein with peptidoglycan-binding domain
MGLGDLELRDSQLIFNEKTGGVLTIEIERLVLHDFVSWQPQVAGTFSLDARINDIDLNWTGKARPFAENIAVSAETRTENADLVKISRFTGPLGLERRAGVYNSYLKHDFTLSADGHLQGQSVGGVDIRGLDYARASEFELLIDQSSIDLDVRYTLSTSNDLHVAGSADLKLGKAQADVSGDNAFRTEQARIQLMDINSSLAADRTVRVSARPQIEMRNSMFSGRVQLSVDRLLNVLRYLQSLSAGDAVTAEQTGLSDWSDKEVTLPKSDVNVAHLHSVSSAFEFTTAAGDVSLNLTMDSELKGIELKTLERSTTVEHLQSALEGLQLRTSDQMLSLHLAGSNVFQGNHIKGPVGEAKFKRVNASIASADLEVRREEIGLQASALIEVDGTELLAREADGLPKTSGSVASTKVALMNSRVEISGQQVRWNTSAEARIDDLKVDFADGDVASAGFQGFEMRNATANQALNLVTDQIIFDGLEVAITRRFIDTLRTRVKPEQTTKGESAEDRTAENDTTLIKAIQQRLQELGYSPGTADGRMGTRTENAIRAFEKDSGRAVTGVANDELLDALQAARPDSDERAPFTVRLARFALENGAKFRFRDATVEPEVRVDTAFKTVELLDVDSRDPAKQATARIVADVNEFTHVQLQASASDLGQKANLNLDGAIENLALPPYSPYAAEFGGVNLESGQLTTVVKATAKQGDLDGTIMLDLENVQFTPLSEQDAKRLAGTAGVPIETAVGLLQDPEGRIKLRLPVTGTITKPDVDISSAIRQAIGGALKKILPTTLFKSIAASPDKAGGVAFEPIKFTPGSAEMDQAARAYADKLVELLRSRPKLSLDFCGRSTAADLAAKPGRPTPVVGQEIKPQDDAQAAKRARAIEKHSPELIELAVERTRIVRRYLISDKGIDAKRVAECRPTFDANDLGSPRVDIVL